MRAARRGGPLALRMLPVLLVLLVLAVACAARR